MTNTKYPADEHRVKSGHIAVTVDFSGRDPFTIEMPLSLLAEEMANFEKQSGISKLHRHSLKKHVQLRKLTQAALPLMSGDALTGVGITCLWLAVNYPLAKLRAQLMRLIREEDSVHITVMMNGGKFAISCSDGFVDLESLTRNVSAPDGCSLYYASDDSDGLAELN